MHLPGIGRPARWRTLGFAVVYAGLAAGLPLPAGRSPEREKNQQRFPCENCPCGCSTAERCWSDCCCHTPAQRLAWARREGVRPPTEALLAARRAGLDVSPWLAKTPKPSVCTAGASPNPTRCCCCKAKAKAKPPRQVVPKSSQTVVLIAALECQGIASRWFATAVATPAPLKFQMPEPWALNEVVEFLSPRLGAPAAAPELPPPERTVPADQAVA